MQLIYRTNPSMPHVASTLYGVISSEGADYLTLMGRQELLFRTEYFFSAIFKVKLFFPSLPRKSQI